MITLFFSFPIIGAGTSKKETKYPTPKLESMKTLPVRQCQEDKTTEAAKTILYYGFMVSYAVNVP